MKIALIQPPVWWTSDPPLGLAQIAGCAKHRGHDVRVFDLNMLLWKRRGQKYENLWNWEQFGFWNDPAFVAGFFKDHSSYLEEILTEVLKTDAKVVAFSVHAGSQVAALALARMIKAEAPKRMVVFGGEYFFKGDKIRQTLADPAVDAVISGAADESFPDLVDAFEAAGRLTAVPGVAVRASSGVVDGGPARPIRDLDSLPFADFTGFPMELYSYFEPRMPMSASRGCIWHCRFCSTREFWPGYSYMSGARIFAEMKHQKKLFPHIGHFEFFDITFNGNMRSVEDLSREMDGAGVYMGFKINAVLRPEMTAGLMNRLYRVGLVNVIYGVESGSPRVLERMNKPFSIETAENVLRDTHAAGIKTAGNFMFGFPGETEEDFTMTLDFLRRNAGSLDRAYASATFTSLEEYSYLTEHKAEFGIRPADEHHLYWETADGTNDYLVRQDRYERFRKLAISLGIDAYKGVDGTMEQDRRNNLSQYYRHKGDHFEAIRNLLGYLETDFYSEPMRKELAAYRKDLQLLSAALRAVKSVNILAKRDGLSADRLLDGSAARLEPRIRGARACLAAMREKGELKIREGRLTVAWAQTDPVEPAVVDFLDGRAGLFLDVAAAEMKSGEAQGAAPECAR
ncbi:MAG: B12-binding domain-containing radical SAM protein [Elusimicrobiota bacterium]